MKTKYIFFAAAFSLLSIFTTSCQKEDYSQNELNEFQGVIDLGSKTHLTGTNWLGLAWDMDDRVYVSNVKSNNGTLNRCIYKVGSTYNGTAYFNKVNANENVGGTDQNMRGSKFIALYPASAAICDATTGTMTLSLNQVQAYAENSMNGSPMYTEYQRNNNDNFNENDNGTVFKFKNLCSQLRLNLQSSGKSVRSIIIESNVALAGNFAITPQEEGPENNRVDVWEAATNIDHVGSRYVILNCNGVSINTAKNFNIFLPVGTYPISIKISTTDGHTATLNSTQAIYFNRDHVKTLTKSNIEFSNNPPEVPYTNAGIFAINTTDHVYIAKGNLMNTAGPDTYYADSWEFAEHPYDMVGTYSNHQTVWNRFSWSTDNPGDNFGMKVDVHVNQQTTNGHFLDWGSNRIKKDANTYYDPNYWFTLSKDEWQYLLGQTGDRLTRHMNNGITRCYGFAYILPATGYSFVAFNHTWTRNDFLYGIGQTTGPDNLTYYIYKNNDPRQGQYKHVEKGLYDCGRPIQPNSNDLYAGIPCLVIYPDNFPADKQLGDYEYHYQQKSFALTDARYNELVDLGCAFLPLLGRGLGAAQNTTASEVLYKGYYNTSTASNNTSEYHLTLTHANEQINVQLEQDTRGNGYAVRLVTPAPADSRHASSSKRR